MLYGSNDKSLNQKKQSVDEVMMEVIVSRSPRSHLDLFEKVNFIKTSTKIDNNELQWHQGSKHSTEI